jgi:hypothetical protein
MRNEIIAFACYVSFPFCTALAAEHRAEEGPVSAVPMAFPDAEWDEGRSAGLQRLLPAASPGAQRSRPARHPA